MVHNTHYMLIKKSFLWMPASKSPKTDHLHVLGNKVCSIAGAKLLMRQSIFRSLFMLILWLFCFLVFKLNGAMVTYCSY